MNNFLKCIFVLSEIYIYKIFIFSVSISNYLNVCSTLQISLFFSKIKNIFAQCVRWFRCHPQNVCTSNWRWWKILSVDWLRWDKRCRFTSDFTLRVSWIMFAHFCTFNLFLSFFSFSRKRTAAYQYDGKPEISPFCVRVCKLSTEQDT